MDLLDQANLAGNLTHHLNRGLTILNMPEVNLIHLSETLDLPKCEFNLTSKVHSGIYYDYVIPIIVWRFQVKLGQYEGIKCFCQ